MGFDRTEQLFFTEGLGQVLIGTDNATLGFIEQTVFGRQHDHRSGFESAVVLDQGTGLIAIEPRHHNVDKDDVRMGIGDLCQSIEAVNCSNYFAAHLFQQGFRGTTNRFRIVDHHHPQTLGMLFHFCPTIASVSRYFCVISVRLRPSHRRATTQSSGLFSTLSRCNLYAARGQVFSLTTRLVSATLTPHHVLTHFNRCHFTENSAMSVRLGIVMDPIAQIAFKKDSSLAMLLAAQARGWTLFYIEQKDLYQAKGEARARLSELSVYNDPQRWFELGNEHDIALSELDVILMRKDPPFDNEFVYSTYLLEQAEQAGVLVVNRPQSLRDCNEKYFATQFSQYTSPTVVSRRADILREFAKEQRDIILKPLDGMGGSMIFRHREGDPNLSVILETLTNHGQQQIMAQGYLQAIKDGDKRILMIDGEPVPYCLARIPAAGETRGNLAAGGRGEARPLTERDREIAAAVGPTLREKGLLFVGLDVIGEHLTEINVTSPTCIREIDAAFDTRIGEQLMDKIAEKLNARSAS